MCELANVTVAGLQWLHCQDQIVTCGRPRMVGSVTKAQCHDESSGGRSVTGVHGSVTGK